MKRLCTLLFIILSAVGLADQNVYTEQLDNSWQNWSWATVNFNNASPVHGGSKSIAVTAGSGQAVYFHHNAQSTASSQAISFWVHGGASGGQLLQVQATLNGGAITAYPVPALAANTWTKVTVPLRAVGVKGATNFDGFWIQDRSGSAQPTFYVDDVSITSSPGSVVDLPVFDDVLLNSWANWSWATVNFSNPTPVHSGSSSISVHENAAFDAVYFHHTALDGSLYKTVSFWIHGGATGGQQLQIGGLANGSLMASYSLPALPANQWKQFVIPLTALGVGVRGDFDGFWIQGRVASPQATYYVDDLTVSVSPVVNPPTTISVDPNKRYDISPLIYGANNTDWVGMGSGFKFARSGGNRLTAYNWENNASNAGSDWFFQNDSLMGSTDEAGWADRVFIQSAIAGGAIPLVTIPCAGYVAADKWGDGDVRNYPDYINTRFKVSLPSKSGGAYNYPPNTTDINVYQDECVNYLKQFAQPNFPIMFSLDNEPDLWSYTHNEIHPNPATYAEMITRSTAYATGIKNVYPSTTIFGPVNYGWYGFMALQGAPDQNNRNFLDFYLAGMKTAGTQAGKRLLDVLDVHWYPEAQGDGIRITTDGESLGLATARIQSTRSLWDSSYIENSWITNGTTPISLIPMIQGKIRTHYPGTKLSITEYNYGGSNMISGAIAQADFLGLLGRNGVYAAANWGLDSSAKAQLAGFKAFIDFDRAGARFGDQGLFVSGETAAENSVYASLDSTNQNRMTLVVINKTTGVTPFVVNIPGFSAKVRRACTIVEGQYITPVTTPVTNAKGKFKFDAPPQSITTIELRAVVD